jgi:hypothetical protein
MQVTDGEQSERILLRNLMRSGVAQNLIKYDVRRNSQFIINLVITGSFLIYVEFFDNIKHSTFAGGVKYVHSSLYWVEGMAILE